MILLSYLSRSLAQGVDICSCSPLVYKWELNFSGECPPANVNIGTSDSITGIKEATCNTFAQVGVTDLVPVNVTRYEILELTRGLEIEKGIVRTELNLQDGDAISFNSESVVNPSFISGGLQAELRGINAQGEEIILFFIVRFTNKCGEPPFEREDSFGWMKFVRNFRSCVFYPSGIKIFTNIMLRIFLLGRHH